MWYTTIMMACAAMMAPAFGLWPMALAAGVGLAMDRFTAESDE